MSDHAFSIPGESDLIAFFGSKALEHSIEDGYWCYEVRDPRDVHLQFSFNIFEQSVQTALHIGDSPITTIVHEGAQDMRIAASRLLCTFSSPGSAATLALRLEPFIAVEWSTLRTV